MMPNKKKQNTKNEKKETHNFQKMIYGSIGTTGQFWGHEAGACCSDSFPRMIGPAAFA